MYPFLRILAIILRPYAWSLCKSNLPRAPARGGDLVKVWLIFVTATPSVVFATEGVEVTSLASMARVTRLMSSLTGMFKWNRGPSFMMGSAYPSCGIPLLLNLPPGRCLSHSNDRLRWPADLPSMEILWAWLKVRIEREG